MRVLVTGSAGHLGEALVRSLRDSGDEVAGLDILDSPFTTRVGSIVDSDVVRECMGGVRIVFHPATLHKPHVVTRSPQSFVDTNVTGTLNLLQEAVAAGVESFIFTSTTSVFGDALVPPAGAPAAWVTEDVTPLPKNIYGVTKAAAEDLCRLFHRKHRLPCVVLRTSRFFPEEDDNRDMRQAYPDDNLKANEYLFRRVDLEDAVSAHLAAAKKAAVERVQAQGSVAVAAQFPDQRGERRSGQSVIGVEPVIAEITLRYPGQRGEFGAHRVGAPARHEKPAVHRRRAAAFGKGRQHTVGDQRRQAAGVEK